MRRLLASTALLFALLAAPALGGGFWTSGISPLPDGVAPGEPWVVDVTVLAHGRSPMEGMKPSITISRGADERSFAARPVGDGVYRANVVFPDAGRWSYAVVSDYGVQDATTFGTVDVADPAAATAGDGGGSARWLVAIGAGLLVALLTAAATRRRPHHAPVPVA